MQTCGTKELQGRLTSSYSNLAVNPDFTMKFVMKFFTEHMFPEIRDRHSDLTDNDYLLFPDIKERNLLKQKTGKLFFRFSKELSLYYFKGGTRLLYSIRHTYATEQWKKGTSIQDIAELMNTSTRMVINVYLGHTDEALLKLSERRGKLKVVK